jgi:hypothetical protein
MVGGDDRSRGGTPLCFDGHAYTVFAEIRLYCIRPRYIYSSMIISISYFGSSERGGTRSGVAYRATAKISGRAYNGYQ